MLLRGNKADFYTLSIKLETLFSHFHSKRQKQTDSVLESLKLTSQLNRNLFYQLKEKLQVEFMAEEKKCNFSL